MVSAARMGLAALTAALAIGAASADEVDDLVARLKPPARFKDHKPAWSVAERQFTFQDFDGPVTVPWYLVMDGQRCVAGIPRGLFQSGCIFVYDFRPGHAPQEPPMPTDRLHIETEIGTHIRTDAFIPTEAGNSPETFDFRVDGERLILTRRYKGVTTYNKWSHRNKTPHKVDTTNIAVFLVDPVLGYVVDTSYDTWTEEKLKKFEYASAATSGRHSTWPEEISCYRIAISSFGKEGFHGYATNMGCTRQHGGDGLCRDGGLVAFLNDQTGWSPAFTNGTGVESRLVVCGPHTDHDFTLDMTRIAGETRDGMTRYAVRHRMLALPPELTRHVWDNMNLLHQGERQVLLRMGRMEDFEAQPLDLAGRERGHPIGGQISEQHARSGRKSLKFTGRTGPGSPTLCLKPGRKYRLETWIKVVELSAEEKLAAEAKARAEAEARRKKDPSLPEFAGLGPPEAYITARFEEWAGGRVGGEPLTTDIVKPGDWKHLTIDFVSPAWGPAIAITFVADNCTAYLDDFRLAQVHTDN